MADRHESGSLLLTNQESVSGSSVQIFDPGILPFPVRDVSLVLLPSPIRDVTLVLLRFPVRDVTLVLCSCPVIEVILVLLPFP